MTPGVYFDLANSAYHEGAGISKSHLDLMAKGPRAYWQAYINPARPPREEKDAWNLGSATHGAILEPSIFDQTFAVEPDPADAPKRPTKRQRDAKKPSDDTLDAIAFWKDFDAQAEGRTILTKAQHDTAWTIAEAVEKHPVAGPLMREMREQDDGKPEVSYYATDPATGALVKCRFDFHGTKRKVDLKTTRDSSPAGFAKSVHAYRYGVQEAWYRKVSALLGHEVGEWIFLAVNSAAPHEIGLYTLPRDYVSACLRQADQNLREIVDARRLDYWPDFGYAGVIELDIPRWAKRAVGIDTPDDDFGGLSDE